MNDSIKTLFAAAMLIVPTVMVCAQTTVPITNKTDQAKPVTYPKAPAKETVYMTYDPYADTCTFTMSPAIESMQVLIENSAAGIVIYDEVTQDAPVIDATLPVGNYSITCTANTGSVFETTFSL